MTFGNYVWFSVSIRPIWWGGKLKPLCLSGAASVHTPVAFWGLWQVFPASGRKIRLHAPVQVTIMLCFTSKAHAPATWLEQPTSGIQSCFLPTYCCQAKWGLVTFLMLGSPFTVSKSTRISDTTCVKRLPTLLAASPCGITLSGRWDQMYPKAKKNIRNHRKSKPKWPTIWIILPNHSHAAPY